MEARESKIPTGRPSMLDMHNPTVNRFAQKQEITLTYIVPMKFKKNDVFRIEDSLNETSFYKCTKQKTNKKEGTSTLTLEPVK